MSVVDDRRSGLDTRAEEQRIEQGERREDADRRALRRRVLKGVKISFHGAFCAVEGVMKNISETGALIMLKDTIGIPDRITIYNDLEGYKIDAEVVRRRADQIGVRFTGYAEEIERSRAQVVNMLDINKAAEQDDDDNAVAKPVLTRQAANRPVFGRRR